jgi:hypothetical protein
MSEFDIKKLRKNQYEIDERKNYIVQDIECCLNCSYRGNEVDGAISCRMHRFHRIGESYWSFPVDNLGKCDKYFDERLYRLK